MTDENLPARPPLPGTCLTKAVINVTQNKRAMHHKNGIKGFVANHFSAVNFKKFKSSEMSILHGLIQKSTRTQAKGGQNPNNSISVCSVQHHALYYVG